MNTFHTNLQNRWVRFSIIEQLANIGSEFGRMVPFYKGKDTGRFEEALARLLELFEFTLADPRWQYPRKREVARLKENILTLFYSSISEEERDGSFRSIDQQFLYYGIAARNR